MITEILIHKNLIFLNIVILIKPFTNIFYLLLKTNKNFLNKKTAKKIERSLLYFDFH